MIAVLKSCNSYLLKGLTLFALAKRFVTVARDTLMLTFQKYGAKDDVLDSSLFKYDLPGKSQLKV